MRRDRFGMAATMNGFWVFGYGSLMWNPGFAFEERAIGRIHGFRRALCVLSHVHRGTPERPGLVLGLDSGGSCLGVGYRVAPSRWDETLDYLRRREQVTLVYREVNTGFRLGDGRRVTALTYAVDRAHPQYAGKRRAEELADIVRQGAGKSGRCIDYILSTLQHLREMAIHDPQLEAVAALLVQAKDNTA
jgi:glutathione-specific gamma-glutamylcyclotransferase